MKYRASPIILGALVAACSPAGQSEPEHVSEAAAAVEDLNAHPTRPNAVRFLEQATFGPTKASVDHVVASTIPAIITEQLNATPISRYSTTYYTTKVTTTPPVAACPGGTDAECGGATSGFVCNAGTCQVGCRATGGNKCTSQQVCLSTTSAIGDCVNHLAFDPGVQFFVHAMTGADQLRQRVAFALAQIWVVSQNNFVTNTTTNNPAGTWASPIAVYLNKLSDDAFANYRTLMYDMTVNPAMGAYLNMANNVGYNSAGEVFPNENYARELLQLFTLGVYQLDEGGSNKLDTAGKPVPAYSQDDVENLAYALTGWTYDNAAHTCPAKGGTRSASDWSLPLLPCEVNHNHTPKPLLLNPITNVRPVSPGTSAVADLNAVLDNIFEHPNLPPFVCKQLIQHLVTSNPSVDYVKRVVAVFKDDGSSRLVRRGNLDSVVRAVLEDPEARGPVPPFAQQPTFGRLRPPALFLTNVLRWLNGTVADPRTLVTNPNVAIDSATQTTLNGTATLNNWSNNMGQYLPRPATVFSYYPPSEPLPGKPTLVGPEFGIQDTGTAMARANFLNALVMTGDGVSKVTGVTVNIAASTGIPDDPGALVQWLKDNMLHGTMSPQLTAIVLDAVSDPTVPVAERKPLGIYLVAISPEYQVQR